MGIVIITGIVLAMFWTGFMLGSTPFVADWIRHIDFSDLISLLVIAIVLIASLFSYRYRLRGF